MTYLWCIRARCLVARLLAVVSATAFCQSGFAATNVAVEKIPPLVPPYNEIPPTTWEQNRTLIVASTVLLVLGLLALVAFLRRPKPELPVPPSVRARNALESAKSQPAGQQLTLISQILRRYFSEAYGIPCEELTTPEFARTLRQNPTINDDLAAAVIQALRNWDENKFSRIQATLTADPLKEAQVLIDWSEKNLQAVRSQQQPSIASAGAGAGRT